MAELKEKGKTGMSTMKKPDLQVLFAETMMEKALKEMRIKEAQSANVRERLKLLTSFSLLKKSVRLFRCKNPVYLKKKEDKK